LQYGTKAVRTGVLMQVLDRFNGMTVTSLQMMVIGDSCFRLLLQGSMSSQSLQQMRQGKEA
jgi:hypothetical protein